MRSTLSEENSWKIQVQNVWWQKLLKLHWLQKKNIMQTSTFGLQFDSLSYDVPLEIRSRSLKHKQLFKLSQWYAQTTIFGLIRYHAFKRKWRGEWHANTNAVADRICTKVCPTSSWVREIKTVVYVWRQTKPNVAASKNCRKRENKTEVCYH